MVCPPTYKWNHPRSSWRCGFAINSFKKFYVCVFQSSLTLFSRCAGCFSLPVMSQGYCLYVLIACSDVLKLYRKLSFADKVEFNRRKKKWIPLFVAKVALLCTNFLMRQHIPKSKNWFHDNFAWYKMSLTESIVILAKLIRYNFRQSLLLVCMLHVVCS